MTDSMTPAVDGGAGGLVRSETVPAPTSGQIRAFERELLKHEQVDVPEGALPLGMAVRDE